jgi:biopolymer transport protein ExbD
MAKSKVAEEMSQESTKLELTPMIDISFLIIIFFLCLPFKTLEGKLAAFLPTDKGIAPTQEQPPEAIKVKVHLLAREEKQITGWGPPKARQDIAMPTTVLYKCGEGREPVDSLEEVLKYIRAAKKEAEKTANPNILGELKAGNKVPHKFVIAVLNKFAEAGMEKVDFFGTALPTKAERERPYLLYPKKNYNTTD